MWVLPHISVLRYFLEIISFIKYVVLFIYCSFCRNGNELAKVSVIVPESSSENKHLL